MYTIERVTDEFLKAYRKPKPLGGVFPYDTGNMNRNSVITRFFSFKLLGGASFAKIAIDDEIAPYVYYTNEKWISPRWHGKKNPNEGWVGSAVLAGAQNIARAFGGYVVAGEGKTKIKYDYRVPGEVAITENGNTTIIKEKKDA